MKGAREQRNHFFFSFFGHIEGVSRHYMVWKVHINHLKTW
jgi:hypothetical protein